MYVQRCCEVSVEAMRAKVMTELVAGSHFVMPQNSEGDMLPSVMKSSLLLLPAACCAPGCAPLHYAAKGGHLDICKYLLAARVSLHTTTRQCTN
jgi:hypothetical protein